MVKEFKELVEEAKDELYGRKDVKRVVLGNRHDSKPGTQFLIDFNVFHKLNSGYVWSTVLCYIDQVNESYYFHYDIKNIPEDKTTLRELIESEFDKIKEALSYEFIYFNSIDEQQKYAYMYGVNSNGREEFIVYLVGNELKYKVL